MKHFLALAFFAACDENKSTDTADSVLSIESGDTGAEEQPCQISVRANGIPVADLADPTVGEDWYLIMYCD